jgi:ankyrin repeat protein
MTTSETSLTIPAHDPRAVAVADAIRGGDVARLRELLDGEPGLARARFVDGGGVARTLLHVAADWPGHFPNGPQTVATLIAAGADVDAAVLHPRGGAPETALHWAASSDDVGVLDALLDGGADIEAPGAIFTGGTAMSDAVVFAQWSAARRLLERGATTTFWQAAALGLLDSVQQHLSTDPRPSSEQITNALWHAARGGQLAVAEHLVEQGADLNWIGHDRKTPLDAARDSGVTELVEWLERRGARPGPSASTP